MMPKVGVEPTLPEENYALNVARLPVPPLRLGNDAKYTCCKSNVNTAIGGAITAQPSFSECADVSAFD